MYTILFFRPWRYAPWTTNSSLVHVTPRQNGSKLWMLKKKKKKKENKDKSKVNVSAHYFINNTLYVGFLHLINFKLCIKNSWTCFIFPFFFFFPSFLSLCAPRSWESPASFSQWDAVVQWGREVRNRDIKEVEYYEETYRVRLKRYLSI